MSKTNLPITGRIGTALRFRWRLVSAMALAIVAITALALWDQNLEAEAALKDFAQEQSSLASILAQGLTLQLQRIAREAHARGPMHVRQERASFSRSTSVAVTVPSGADAGRPVVLHVPIEDLIPALRDPSGAPLTALLLVPGDTTLIPLAGGRVSSTALLGAANQEANWVRLTRDEASELGLARRTAVAGLARADVGELGKWHVIVVASAARERDRAIRAEWRFVLSVGLAALVVAAFGSAALRTQRTRFELERALTLAAQQEQQNAQLERENRAATMLTLAAGVAHEVSTPLSVIAGRAEQLLTRPSSANGYPEGEERLKRLATTIIEQSHRIREVVRGFLNLARGDAPILGRVRPHDVARAACELVEHRFAKAHVRLSLQVSEALPAASGDALLLQQALVNLLLNACDACAEGGHVHATAICIDQRLRFTVEDDGSGISEINLARVTEPFFSTKPRAHGAGLGLAIAKEIITMHRGTLTLEARQPRGTRAMISIPSSEETGHAS